MTTSVLSFCSPSPWLDFTTFTSRRQWSIATKDVGTSATSCAWRHYSSSRTTRPLNGSSNSNTPIKQGSSSRHLLHYLHPPGVRRVLTRTQVIGDRSAIVGCLLSKQNSIISGRLAVTLGILADRLTSIKAIMSINAFFRSLLVLTSRKAMTGWQLDRSCWHVLRLFASQILLQVLNRFGLNNTHSPTLQTLQSSHAI